MKFILRGGHWLLILGTALALMFAAGCSGASVATVSAPATSAAASPSPSPKAAAGPAIKIVSPLPSAQSGIGFVTVVVSVGDFKLVSPLGQANVPGQGHINYFMDVDPPAVPGKPALTDMGTYAATAETNYTWSNIGPGQHKFSVELVNNDQTPLNPPVTANIAVQVAAQSGPSVAVILSPRTNAVIAGNSVTIAAQAANFKLVDAAGQADAVNEGHLYYFMDVEAPTTTMTPGAPIDTAAGTFAATSNTSYTWQNVPPGVHTFSIELVNNDGTPTNPPVTSKIAVIVRGASPASGNPPASGPALSFIAVTPLLQNTLQPGNSRQFNAIGIYSDNSEQDLASQVTWTSSEPAIASISTTGLATSVAGGITAITASLSGVTSPSVTLNVYAPTGG